MARKSTLHIFFASWSCRFAAAIFLLVIVMALFAPWLWTQDPTYIDAVSRLKGPSLAHWLGTDDLGRDLYSRIVYGSRVSMVVGMGVLAVSVVFGVLLGALAGYFRVIDGPIMRTMDGIMAIPAVLLAIALVSLSGASMVTVIVGIAIPEIPRVTRLVRSVMLGVRSEPYVEAAVTLGTPTLRIILRHMLPNAIAPLIVQGTFIFAHAVLLEAILSFLGAGVPPEIPSWGNIVAQGRSYFQLLPGLVLYPGIVLSFSILAINIIGDAARDALDPRLAARS